MPRPNNKTKKIAYKILGTPDNIRHKRSKEERYIDKRLLFEESYRVR